MAAIRVSVTQLIYVLGEISEEEDVVLADFSGDFNLIVLVLLPRQLRIDHSHWLHRKYR